MIPEDGEDKLTTMGDLIGSFPMELENSRKENSPGLGPDISQGEINGSSSHRRKKSNLPKEKMNVPVLGIIDESQAIEEDQMDACESDNLMSFGSAQ